MREHGHDMWMAEAVLKQKKPHRPGNQLDRLFLIIKPDWGALIGVDGDEAGGGVT